MSETKVPLALAAQNLATLMEAIDNGNLSETIVSLFNDTRLDVSAAVDRRICFFDICERHIESLEDISRKYKQAAKGLEGALETVKKNTLEIMKAVPDAPYKGELGRLTVQKNNPAVHLFLETSTASISNAVDAQDIEKMEIDEKFYDVRTYYVLVMDRIKKAIEAGEELPWAELKRKERLGWPKK